MNAEVTMPIGDLDKLRDDLKNAENQVKELKKNQKKVELVVREHTIVPECTRYNIHSTPYYKMKDKYVEQPPQYVNFEDVVKEIKKEEESKVIEKLGSLEREVLQLKKDKESNKTTYIEELNAVKKAWANEIKAKEDEIALLKGEKIDLGKDAQIKDLQEQLERLKEELESKNSGILGWLNNLFSK